MKPLEQEIVDWMINNVSLVTEICEEIIERRIESHSIFFEEANKHFYQEVKSEMAKEATSALGCSIEDFNSVVNNKKFEEYMKVAMGIYG